jgi:hypothetical protein
MPQPLIALVRVGVARMLKRCFLRIVDDKDFPGVSMNRSVFIFLLFLMTAQKAFASETGTHADPIAPTLLALITILAAAKLAGEQFERLKMPAVLGELIARIIPGNLILINAGWNFFEPLRVTSVMEG